MNKYGLRDDDFLRAKVPMSKEEIRVITMLKLEAFKGMRCIDIGAGTGSLTIQAALIAGDDTKFYAVEKKPEAVELIKKNFDNLNVNNVELIEANAPELMEHIGELDRVIIGGSGSNLIDILKWCDKRLVSGGIIVANFILMKKVAEMAEFLENNNYDVDITNVNVSRAKKIAGDYMMMANNPINIISARKRS